MCHAFPARLRIAGAVALAGLLGACAQTPMGPMVQVMPGPGKSFGAFQQDQAGCKTYAAQQVAGQAQAANNRAIGAGVLTTVLGAGLGGAIGGGSGAGIGAASGAGVGAGVGGAMSANDQVAIQQQYDNAFSQCMYSQGNQVPGYMPVMAEEAPVRVAMGPDPALVRATQAELNRIGYLDAAPDGVLGSHTSAAIRSYERSHELRVDGTVSRHLLASLQATPSGAAPVAAAAPASSGWVAPTQAAAPASGGWVAPAKTP